MTLEDAIAALRAEADPIRAAADAASLKTTREVLGIRPARLTELAKEWRQSLSVEDRLELANDLWEENLHESRIMAAKLLIQARMANDEDVWDLIATWVPQLDNLVIADAVCDAGARRFVADPSRIDEIEAWIETTHRYSHRAAFMMAMPWARLPNPKPMDDEIRGVVLGWAAALIPVDRGGVTQSAIAEWVRTLSKHDPDLAKAFLAGPGAELKGYALKEAGRNLK